MTHDVEHDDDIDYFDEGDGEPVQTTEKITAACPFCGKADCFVERKDFSSAYVFCNDCAARGPVSSQESDMEEEPGGNAAIRAWNIRAPLADIPRFAPNEPLEFKLLHPLTDTFIAERYPDADNPEGREEIRRQFDTLMDQIRICATFPFPRHPEAMAPVVVEKARQLPERLEIVKAALAGLPWHWRQWQWSADAKPAFGDRFVRSSISGDNGHGFGKQWIACVNHVSKNYVGTLADFIAAANPDTVSMMVARIEQLEAALALHPTDGQKVSAHCLGFAVEDVIWRGQRASIVDQNFPIGTPITSAHTSQRPADQLAERYRRIGEMAIDLLGLQESASDPGVDFGFVFTQAIEKLTARPACTAQPHIAGWINEDELPESYPYDIMHPYSKVDVVRLFPVFVPSPSSKYLNLVDGKIYELISQDGEGVTFRREGRETARYLGRAEFDRRFQLQAPSPQTLDEAVAHMRNQAPDAEFVSLEERITTVVSVDRSAEAVAALATEGK